MALSNYLNSVGAVTTGWSTSVTSASLASGQGFLTLSAPSSSGAGSVSVALNLGASTADNACLATHPASTGANVAYLRGTNGACTAPADPAAVATFGVYTAESKKTIYVREIY